MDAKTQVDLIQGWITKHDIDWSSLKPQTKRRLINKLNNCVSNIQKAHERAASVIAQAKEDFL